MPPIAEHSYDRDREFIMRELERLAKGAHTLAGQTNEGILRLSTKMDDMKDELKDGQLKMAVQIGMLNVKAGVWGALGGAVIAVGGIIIAFIKSAH